MPDSNVVEIGTGLPPELAGPADSECVVNPRVANAVAVVVDGQLVPAGVYKTSEKLRSHGACPGFAIVSTSVQSLG